MKELMRVSVGAFGQVNRATSNFLSQIAEQGSKRPERLGYWAMGALGDFASEVLLGQCTAHGALEAVMQKME